MASRGFSLVELVVSLAVTLVIAGAIFTLTTQAQGMFRAQSELADVRQRLRIAADSLQKDLIMAGSGLHTAAVLPYRRGLRSADPPGSFFHDRISILYVPSTAAEAALTEAMADPQTSLLVSRRTGFTIGTTAVVFDDTGAFDIFLVTNVADVPPALEHAGQTFAKPYGKGAAVAEVTAVTYWLKTGARSSADQVDQLMKYDGLETDLPLTDNSVALGFEYFGDPTPPAVRRPLTEPVGPWTSYGPKPPPADVDDPWTPTYSAGENCTFTHEGGQAVSRRELAPLTPAHSLVKLTPAQLTDGPWCPDPAAPDRFDADLLRIRRIRVALRVQAGDRSLRGTGVLFARSGTSRSGDRLVPDRQVQFDVTPRNLNLGR